MLSAGLNVIVATVGALVAAAASYLALLAIAAFRVRSLPVGPATRRLAVLVPAHDEADLIQRCLASLHTQHYPRHLFDVVVIADNCTDDTAVIAAAAGAQVLVRDVPGSRGKGQALRWAIDQLLPAQPTVDGIVIVDADSVCDPGLLQGLAGRLEAGADVVQGDYLALDDDPSPRAQLRGAALLLFHKVRFSGRAALGLPCHLVGNGMLFSRALLETNPWSAFTSAEDLEYSVDLRLAGFRPEFAPEAEVRAPMPASGRAASTQRLRWEGGRAHVVRTRLPLLLRAAIVGRKPGLLDAAVDLAVPPLGLLAVLIVAGASVAGVLVLVGATPAWTLAPWVLGLVALPGFVIVGLWAGDAPASMYRALLRAPAFVLHALFTRMRLLGGLRATTWERTERPGDAGRPTPERAEVAGVPIDAVDGDEAVDRAMAAVRARRFMQVCTVNLDFLVNAQRDVAVHTLLASSELNLADGAPVVWLQRLLGHPQRGRVPGCDFAVSLVAAAAREGARVFFLGGENGAADRAAARLTEMHPALQVAGIHEPPRATLAQMDHDAILDRIERSRADVLLVALGHPMQDKWIQLHRHRIDVSVAVGVGCTFDLIAGDRRRAPSWMQRCGLEWCYRALHEPRRLGARYAIDAWWLLAVLVPHSIRQRLGGARPDLVKGVVAFDTATDRTADVYVGVDGYVGVDDNVAIFSRPVVKAYVGDDRL